MLFNAQDMQWYNVHNVYACLICFKRSHVMSYLEGITLENIHLLHIKLNWMKEQAVFLNASIACWINISHPRIIQLLNKPSYMKCLKNIKSLKLLQI